MTDPTDNQPSVQDQPQIERSQPKTPPNYGRLAALVVSVLALFFALSIVAMFLWHEPLRMHMMGWWEPSIQAPVNAPTRDVEPEIEALSARLAALETIAKTPDPAMAEINRRLTILEQEIRILAANSVQTGVVARLSERVEGLQNTIDEVAAHKQDTQSLLLAIGQLRDAVNQGRPFLDELKTVAMASQDDPEMRAALLQLREEADRGIRSRASLAIDFDSLVPKLTRAAIAPDDQGWRGAIWRFMAAMVTIRRVDGDGQEETPQAHIARAERQIRQGDLGEAVASLQNLRGAALDQAAPWLEAAQTRLAAEQALSALTAEAIDRSARQR